MKHEYVIQNSSSNRIKKYDVFQEKVKMKKKPKFLYGNCVFAEEKVNRILIEFQKK